MAKAYVLCRSTLICLIINLLGFVHFAQSEIDETTTETYTVEGKVFPPDSYATSNWQSLTRVLVNGGDFVGFLKEDGTFTINNVPSGSYVVEVANPNHAYEPVRVEINSKGKYRARKVNYIQTSQVLQVPYPLKMKPLARFRYFQVREQWRVTDFLFSPMEMEQLNNLKYDLPEVSEVLTSLFTGNEKQKPRAVKASKKRQ
ncbi:ER membrane protein complex subunit 7 [Blattella germanica]|nr:ER membrane protein complex subunit 7 [Blattella germanica]